MEEKVVLRGPLQFTSTWGGIPPAISGLEAGCVRGAVSLYHREDSRVAILRMAYYRSFARRGSLTLKPEGPVRRVLIYRLGSLGDTVVALPGYHLLARKYPDAERVLLTNFPVNAKAPASAAVLGESGLIHRYMRYTVGTRSLTELLRLVWEIRRFKPDLLVYMMDLRSFESIRRDRIFFRLAGVRRIVGLPDSEDMQRRLDEATGLYEQEAFRLGRLIAEVGDARAGDLESWDLRLTATEKETAKAELGALAGRPLIVCGPATKMQAKDWGRDNWRELLGRLGREYPEHGLALVGAQDDAEFSEYAARDWAGPKVNLCGRVSPRETAAVLAHADVFLGPDSGPMHLAASVGVACVIAFSAHGLPGVWFPMGRRHEIVYHKPECFNCGLETCVVMEKKCMRSITVDEMQQAVDRVLRRAVGVRANG
jgi:heptosyltransferase III